MGTGLLIVDVTEGDALGITVHAWDGSRFAAEAHEAYRFDGEHWHGRKA